MDWRELYVSRLCGYKEFFYILSLLSIAFLVFLGFSFVSGELSAESELIAIIDVLLAVPLLVLSLGIIGFCRGWAEE